MLVGGREFGDWVFEVIVFLKDQVFFSQLMFVAVLSITFYALGKLMSISIASTTGGKSSGWTAEEIDEMDWNFNVDLLELDAKAAGRRREDVGYGFDFSMYD